MQTLYMMKTLVNKSFLHPWIRERAGGLALPCQRNKQCEAKTLSDFVRHNLNYMADPYGVESIHDPVTWIESRLREGQAVYADCDDMVIYLATLLKSIGHAPSFKVIARDSTLIHVFVFSDGLNLDPTMPIGANYGQIGRTVLLAV